MLMFPSEINNGSVTGLPQPLNKPTVMAVLKNSSSDSAVTIGDNQCTCSGIGVIYATKGFSSFVCNRTADYSVIRDNGNVTTGSCTANVSKSLPSNYSMVAITCDASAGTTVTFS